MWVVSFTLQPFYPRGKDPNTHWTEVYVDPEPVWTCWQRKNHQANYRYLNPCLPVIYYCCCCLPKDTFWNINVVKSRIIWEDYNNKLRTVRNQLWPVSRNYIRINVDRLRKIVRKLNQKRFEPCIFRIQTYGYSTTHSWSVRYAHKKII